MKKFLLTLIVTMLTCIGAWADGEVTLSPNPGGTIELNLTDDASGRVYDFTSPLMSDKYNVSVSFLYDGEASSDYVSVERMSNWNYEKLKFTPKAVTTDAVKVTVTVKHNNGSQDVSVFDVTVNNEQKIPATLSGVPSSTRVGITGTAVVNVPGYTAGDDYTVEYSVINGSALTIDAATGDFEAVAEGTATIQAVVTPTADGSATAYVARTITKEVLVEKAIEGTINTTFDNLTLNLGQFYEIASPSATWDPELTPVGGSTSYYTSWEITDPTGCINGVYDKNSNKIQLIPINPSDDPVTLTVRAKYIQQNWVGSVVDSEDIMAISPATTFNVTIVTPTCDFTLTPSGDVALDIVDDLSAGVQKTASATWSNTDADMYFEVTCDNEAAVGASNNNGTITIKPKALTATPATVTVSAVWKKVVNGQEIKLTESKSFQVTVDDKTLVKELTVPQPEAGEEFIEIQKGKETLFPILFTPFDAEFQTPTSDNDNVTVRYALKDKAQASDPDVSDYNVLIVDATSAALNDEATITITPKAGSPAEAKTFKVKVGKPELPVTDVKPQTMFRVGDPPVNTGLSIPDDANIPEDEYTVTYTSSNEDVIKVTNDGSITAQHVGQAKITVRFTPIEGKEAYANYKEWYREMDVVVKPAKLHLSLTVTPSEFVADKDDTQTGQIVVGTSVFPSGATFDLSVEGTDDAEIVGDELQIKPNAPVQTFVVKLTADPNGNPDYEAFETTAQILVKGDATDGVILTTHYVKDADGNDTNEVDYVEVNVPTPGAFGTPLVDEPTYTSSDATSLADLKSAPKVKVTGLLANSDVQELVHLIGGELCNTDKNTSVCTSLDMGEAKMVEAITSTAGFCSFVPTNYKYMGSVQELVLPQPAVGVANGTVLPANFNTFFGNNNNHSANALESLTIPEGWTEIADYFGTFDGSGATTFQKLTTLKLANTIEKIGAFAFADSHVKVLDMPYNIKRINKGAFSPCGKLQDVYFHGPAPEFVHTNAFAGQTQFCNNTVKDNQLAGVVDPTITRFEYYNGDGDNRVLACLLHYPKEYKEYYVDMTRRYDVIPSDMPYSKGGNTFTPDYWTPTFISAVKAALNARYPNQITNLYFDDADPNIYVGSVLDYGVKDAYYGYSMIWPSQSQMTTGFGIAQAGYQWGGDPLDPITQYDPTSTYYKDGTIDKRGLYQFIVALDNADIDFKFEQDQWYTISIPYDLTADQVKEVFGAQTQVCRFSDVTREIDGDDKTLILEFRKSTMGDRTDDLSGVHYEADGMEPEKDFPGIRHHYPYMIKPSGTFTNKYVVEENGKWHFYGTGFTGITGTIQPDKITKGGVEYIFAPNLSETAIKKNSYILVERKDKAQKNGKYIHEYVFYKGVLDQFGITYVNGGKANQNTAYVQLSPEDGEKEYADFFKDATPIVFNGSTNAAPINASLFGFDDDDETTQIEKVVIVCGTDRVPDNKVYTINGQLVNNSVLAPGLYIKNGKKFIVK